MVGDGAESVTFPITVPDLIRDPAALPLIWSMRQGTWAPAFAGAAMVGGRGKVGASV